MDFAFNDDQQALRDAVARWAERSFPFARRHSLARAGGASRAVWTELAELGLTGLVVPPEQEGLGLGPVEALVVLEELGRALVPVPYAEAALMLPTLLAPAARDWAGPLLSALAEGRLLAVPAWQERHPRSPALRVATVAVASAPSAEGHDAVLTGRKSLVPAGDEADGFVVLARHSGAPADAEGLGLYWVTRDAAGLTCAGHPTQDGGRAAELALERTPARCITQQAGPVWALAQDVAVASACAEGVGLMEALLALTVEHLNTRRQFGVPLSSFQALRHRVADVKMHLELARSMAYWATLKLGAAPGERRRAMAQAKLQLNDSARFVGQQCIQLSGGIGVTDDYAASHYFKRLTALELSWGDSWQHLEEVALRLDGPVGVLA